MENHQILSSIFVAIMKIQKGNISFLVASVFSNAKFEEINSAKNPVKKLVGQSQNQIGNQQLASENLSHAIVPCPAKSSKQINPLPSKNSAKNPVKKLVGQSQNRVDNQQLAAENLSHAIVPCPAKSSKQINQLPSKNSTKNAVKKLVGQSQNQFDNQRLAAENLSHAIVPCPAKSHKQINQLPSKNSAKNIVKKLVGQSQNRFDNQRLAAEKLSHAIVPCPAKSHKQIDLFSSKNSAKNSVKKIVGQSQNQIDNQQSISDFLSHVPSSLNMPFNLSIKKFALWLENAKESLTLSCYKNYNPLPIMRKIVILLIVSLIGICGFAKKADKYPAWKSEASGLVNVGRFTDAGRLLSGLPEKTQKKFAVSIDSLREIMRRIRLDFCITPEAGKIEIGKVRPDVTSEMIQHWKQKKYLETMVIDGKEWWFRKAIRNLWLLNNDDSENAKQNEYARIKDYLGVYKTYIETMKLPVDKYFVRNWKHAQITFTLTVKPNVVPDGSLIRVWLPFPYNNGRQKNFRLISSSDKVKFSRKSLHHTVYMEKKAVAGNPTRFTYTFSYDVGAQVFSYNYVKNMLQPYDVNSKVYKEYTSSQYPHIMLNQEMRDTAMKIIGNEKNPLEQASLIYNWIVTRYPWAGAREYSTIPNMAEYVLNIHHGDCGQVSLLYITLLRSIGIPARWESGWDLTPGAEGMHDWAEVYFEGVGWVPADVSRGRTTVGEVLQDFYKTSIDPYRLATNQNINQPLDPPKKFIRSETVDFQMGEVEWKGGNIYNKDWSTTMKVDSLINISKVE
jgi:sulfur relay (sulfurtransferase) DsrC/TusE family protein